MKDLPLLLNPPTPEEIQAAHDSFMSYHYCHDPICFGWDGERTPDADAYEKAWPYLLYATKHWLEKHLTMITDALSTVTTLTMPDDQPNIWSVDFIIEEDRVWLIDMAQAWRSAYWNPKKIKNNHIVDAYV